MIKYIGSKRRLVDTIVDIVDFIPSTDTVCDLFTGTTRVAQGLKRAGYRVTANDVATYSEVLALTYITCDRRDVDIPFLKEKLRHLASLPGHDGYFTQAFSRDARYFQEHNTMRIDAIRPEIDRIAENRIEWAVLLTSLMEAADRVDSTTGVQMAYVKKWAKRSYKDLDLRLPSLLKGSGKTLREDALDLAPQLDDFDLTYVDPPYNQHSYFANYHIWETLIRNDQPEAYGIANKRIDCRDPRNKSPFNFKTKAWAAFTQLLNDICSRHILVSFKVLHLFASA